MFMGERVVTKNFRYLKVYTEPYFWIFFVYFWGWFLPYINLTAKVGKDSSVLDTYIIWGRGFLHSGNEAKISKPSRNDRRSN